MNITEFLLARISEDEAAANAVDLLSSEMETISTHYLPEFADYMLRWQPNSIRAECAAKRAILEMHSPADYRGIGMESPNACNICGKDTGMHDWEWDKNSFPCNTIKALAAVYADHPEYDPAWRTDAR